MVEGGRMRGKKYREERGKEKRWWGRQEGEERKGR